MRYTLDCDHCGGAAVISEKNLFGENDADRCDACGIRGSVVVEEGVDDDSATASWQCSEESWCADPTCSECAEHQAIESARGGSE